MSEDLAFTRALDTWARSDKTAANYATGNKIRLKGSSFYGYLHFPEASALAGRIVLAAELQGHVSDAAGSHTLTVTPCSESWTPGGLTWANKPAVIGAQAVTAAVGATSAGDLVTVNLTTLMQAVAAGQAWYGVRLVTDNAAERAFWSANSGQVAWSLVVDVSEAPDVPTDLAPDTGSVSSPKPTLSWTFADLGGVSTEQAQARVQIDAAMDAGSPDFDSGWVTAADPMLNLASTAYGGLSGSTYWRVAVKDGAGLASDWSDWAAMTYTAKPSLVWDSPSGGVVGDPTLEILAHLSSGDVGRWRLQVADTADPTRIPYEAAGVGPTVSTAVTVPDTGGRPRVIFFDDHTYRLTLRVWEAATVRAVGVIGDPPWIESHVDVTFDDDTGVTPVTDLQVEQYDDGPRCDWVWTRGSSADRWLVSVDGRQVAILDPDDVTADAGTYTWRDSGQIPPLRPIQVSVRAVENGDRSEPVYAEARTEVGLTWLISDRGTVALYGLPDWADSVQRTDQRASYQTIGGGQVDVVYSIGILNGRFEGATAGTTDDQWDDMAVLADMAAHPEEPVRMVWGSSSELVQLSNVTVLPSSATRLPNLVAHGVRFDLRDAEV